MDRDRAWRILTPTWFQQLPEDLQIVVGYLVVATASIVLPGVRESLLRPALALPLVLFVPGYLFIAALFPEAGSAQSSDSEADEAPTTAADAESPTADQEAGIDGIERVALSFGTSIAIVPLLGLILNFTPFGIRLVPIMVTLLAFCAVTLIVAGRRRRAIPPAERFTVDVRGALEGAWTELTTAESRTDAALNVLLAISVILAVTSVGYAVAVPKQGESFTEFYLLTENEDGELVADDYPTRLTQGENASLVVGIGNQEHEPVEYTVVVLLQRATVVNNSTTNTTTVRVQEQRELRRFSTRLAHNETWHRNHTIAPTMTGERLRLVYLLYRGTPPATPTVDNAYREVHLWITVTDASAASIRAGSPEASNVRTVRGAG